MHSLQSQKFQKYPLIIVLLLLVGFGSVLAQRITARLTGTVTDSSGAALSNVKISVNNASAGLNYTATTDAGGRFAIPSLPPGVYQVKAERDSFKTLVREGVILRLDQTADLDLTLEVGNVKETVTVAGSVASISTESSEVGSVIENKQITEIPLNGRLNIVGLLVLAPGVQDFESQSSPPTFGINPHIGGGNTREVYYSLDGMSNTENNNVRGGGNWPSVEAIQEFKVISNNASAEFGYGGSQIAVISKGGTNEFHGTLLWFNRNRIFAAQNALVKLPEKPKFNRNEFGFTLSGPVILPGYDGHDRTFIFGNYEGFRLRTPVTIQAALPTQAMRQGNFAGLPMIKDPLTGDPFPNNQIPQNRIDPIAAKLQSFYPAPNITGTGSAGTGINYRDVITNEQDTNRFMIRADHKLSDKSQINGRFFYSNLGPFPQVSANSIFNALDVQPTKGQIGERMRSAALTHTYTFSPRLLNELRAGYRYLRIFRTPRLSELDPATLIPGLPEPVIGGLPSVNITGFLAIGDTLPGSADKSYQWQVLDNLTLIKGAHTLKFGYEANDVNHYNIFNPAPQRGGLNFANRYTGTGIGAAYADFLLGLPVSTSRPDPGIPTQFASLRHAFFVQDDWKLRRNLTFNLGLRYEYQPVPNTKFGLLASYDPQSGKQLVFGDQFPERANPALIANLPIALAKDVGLPSDFGEYIGSDKNNFGPRLGFAWQPVKDAKLVVRGGYGIYYDVAPNTLYKDNALLSSNPPFLAISTFESGATVPTITLSNPFPGAGALPSNPSLGSMAPNLINPLIHQWNLTVEHEVRETAFRISYVGNRGTHEFGAFDLNAVLPQPGEVQPRRPYQPFAGITWVTNPLDSITHQLQIGIRKQYGKGLSFGMEYQFVRALGLDSIENPFDFGYSRGNLDGVRRHGMVANYIWDLPFGKGKRWINRGDGAGVILGGWQFSGIVTAFTGAPFSVSFDSSVAGCPGGRADQVGDPYPANRTKDQWFDPAAFKAPDSCRYGASGRNAFFGPGNFNWDAAFVKNTKIKGERINLQFRSEFFNILNHPQWSNPLSNITGANPGRITSTSGERQIQFALKLGW